MDVIKEKQIGKYNIKVVRDEWPISPREDDNLGTMVCFHGRYDLGDKHDYDYRDYPGWDEMEKSIIKREDVCEIIPIYMYDHSGITINTTGFSCPWDSGQIGFIFVSKEKVREWYDIKRIDSKTRERVIEHLKAEVETYDNYLTGSVYGFIIEDDEEREIDSCYGYYGEDYCMTEAESFVKSYCKKDETIVK